MDENRRVFITDELLFEYGLLGRVALIKADVHSLPQVFAVRSQVFRGLSIGKLGLCWGVSRNHAVGRVLCGFRVLSASTQ